MVIRMVGIVKRGGQWVYRRRVPLRLRSIIGTREIRKTVGTSDLAVAQRRWQAVHAEVDRMFAETEKEARNPSLAAYTAVERWRQWQAARPYDPDHEDAVDIGILSRHVRRRPEDSRPFLGDAFPRLADRLDT